MSADVQIYSLDRKDGQERLVFALREFNGAKYFDLRVHFRGSDGVYRPTKTGVTIKLSEIFYVADAFEKATKLAETVKR